MVFSSQMKIASGTVATLAVIVGAAIGVDDRYAHASDIKQITQQLSINQMTSEVAVLEIRRNSLQDKIYEGQSRNSKARSDIEILDRNIRELRDVEQQINIKRRAIEEVKEKK